MKTLYATFWREMKYNMGRKGVWIGRIANIAVSILTAFAMGMIYAFSSDAQDVIGVGNVSLFLLSGFFLQFLVLTSVSVTPNNFWADIRSGSLEFVFYYKFSITQYIFGMYSAQFLIDLVISIPFLIALGVFVALNSMPPVIILVFVAFVIFSFMCMFSVSMLYSAIYAVSKHFMGYNHVVTLIAYFICGVYFPVQGYTKLFGKTAGWIAIGIVLLLPYTYIFDLSRFIIFGEGYTTIFVPWLEFLLLICSSILFFVLSLLLFKKGLNKLRKEGFASYRY